MLDPCRLRRAAKVAPDRVNVFEVPFMVRLKFAPPTVPLDAVVFPATVIVLALAGLLIPAEPDKLKSPLTLMLSPIVTPPEVLAKVRLLLKVTPLVVMVCAPPLPFNVTAAFGMTAEAVVV